MEAPRQLAYPLSLNVAGQFATVAQGSPEDIANNIAIVVSWPIGTRRGAPSFGCEPQAFALDLPAIRAAVAASEPRASDVSDELLREALGVANAQVSFT